MTQFRFRFAFPSEQERDRIRNTIRAICIEVGFFSTHQVTVISPPQMLRFIAANAASFVAWVRAVRKDAAETRRVLGDIAQEETK